MWIVVVMYKVYGIKVLFASEIVVIGCVQFCTRMTFSYCIAGSLCPAKLCPVRQRTAQRPAPTMVGERLVPKTGHTQY